MLRPGLKVRMNKTVLIAWELGGGLGHVMRAAAFAREFVRQGARVVVALSDLAGSTLAKWPEGVIILQSPMRSRELKGFNNQASYGEILFSCGYHDGDQIRALVGSWRHLMDLVMADIVVADHAPSAHLAARLNKIPLVRVGTGFFSPPLTLRTPRFRTWQGISESRMSITEGRVLNIINRVATSDGAPANRSISEALAPDLDLITSWPEFDPYATVRPQGSVEYISNERTGSQGIEPRWPPSAKLGKKKIVAYLKGDYNAIEPVLRTLGQGYAVVAYVSNLNAEMSRRFVTTDLWLAPKPIDLAVAAQSCDAVICHGGAGTMPIFLEAGKPVLTLHYQAEQRINGDKVAELGAGLCVDDKVPKNSFAQLLSDFMSDSRYAAAAQAIASRWEGKEDAIVTGTARVLQLLGNFSAPPVKDKFVNVFPESTVKPFAKLNPSMQVEVTTRCNFTCFYCAGRDMPQKDMDYETFCRLLDQQIATYGIPPIVSLQGEGEPTINRDFFHMAARVKEVGSTPYTITNGTYKDWQEFLPLFPSIGVSMDTLDEAEAEKIGRFNLPRVQQFIENIAAHMPVIVHTVLLSPGAHAVTRWCKERGIRQIIQSLQGKPDYQYRYPQIITRQPKEEKFSCSYLREDTMRYYNLEGIEMPCPFIKNAKQYPGLVEMKRLQQARQRPVCCSGCTMTGPKDLSS